MAEAFLKGSGKEHFRAYSAGSHPKRAVHPLALQINRRGRPSDRRPGLEKLGRIRRAGRAANGFRLYGLRQRRERDVPIWSAQPIPAHWGIEDPAAVEGAPIDKERAFVLVVRYIKNRISAFVNLPIRSLDALTLRKQLNEIGHQSGASLSRLDVA
jgi:arsenate reductase